MPVYEYACAECGPFERRGSALDASAPRACPECGSPAPRRFTAPGVARMPAPLRRAREREERSAHAPDLVGAPTGRPLPWGHRH
jgi:putative FmdB family regulatory protein